MSYKVNKNINILRRDSPNLVRYGTRAKAEEILMNTNVYVGGSLNSSGEVLRGLSPDEERKFLPTIIATADNSPNWEQKVESYWNNIRVPVPYGRKGKELEIGFTYKTEKDAHESEAAVINLYKNISEDLRNDGIKNGSLLIQECQIRQKKGSPSNISDYILYRYCLVTNKVANSVDYVNYSPKIAFYIYSKDKDVAEKHFELQKRKVANTVMYEVLGDDDKKKQILRMFGINPANLDPKEIDLTIESKAGEFPTEFVAYAKDNKLVIKAFVEECISLGALRRIPNTETVHYGDKKIGDNMDEVVFFFENPKNNDAIKDIKGAKSYHQQLAKDGILKKFEPNKVDILRLMNENDEKKINSSESENPISDINNTV